MDAPQNPLSDTLQITKNRGTEHFRQTKPPALPVISEIKSPEHRRHGRFVWISSDRLSHQQGAPCECF